MKNWKKAIALVASAAALVSVAACGSSNAGGSSDSGKKTVGFVAVGPEGGFRTANEKDIQQAFEDAGFDLTYSPTQNNDQQKQIQAFNKFVNDEVDAIILSSTEDSGWDDSLKKAAEAEIPVFTVDRNVDVKDAEAKKAIVAHIGPSNVWCGEQAAEFVGHAVGGVCPFAVNDGVEVYLDESLRRFETVFPACGSSNSAIGLTCEELERYARPVAWIDVCKGWRDEG